MSYVCYNSENTHHKKHFWGHAVKLIFLQEKLMLSDTWPSYNFLFFCVENCIVCLLQIRKYAMLTMELRKLDWIFVNNLIIFQARSVASQLRPDPSFSGAEKKSRRNPLLFVSINVKIVKCQHNPRSVFRKASRYTRSRSECSLLRLKRTNIAASL